VGCVRLFRSYNFVSWITAPSSTCLISRRLRTIQLRTGGPEPAELDADLVINSAGLDAWGLSRRMTGLDAQTVPPSYLAKGNDFNLTGARAPFHDLIYPVPETGDLGIHLTLDLGGQATSSAWTKSTTMLIRAARRNSTPQFDAIGLSFATDPIKAISRFTASSPLV
jgi:hypothetical protein